MLEYIKPALNYLTFDFGVNAYLIALGIFLANALVFVIELAVTAFKKARRESSYFLCFSLVCFLLTAYFIVQDYKGAKLLFLSFESIYAFLTLYMALLLTFFALLKKRFDKVKEKVCKEVIKPVIKEEYPPVSNAVKYFKKSEIFSGYLDVGYVKQLINELKQKPLSESDYKDIEELEVYLLRFITRQPDAEERAILSNYLSMLIKKLALYAC
ncbi:MAG: hypothetical protein IJA97_00345 [Clostridia bacterium]|nr:hypothetical protein [Clostridia bacterium]